MSVEKGLCNRLREVRKRLGKSQADIASAAGIARQTVGGIEAGTYSVSMAVALKIARALGCLLEELFWLEDERASVEATLATGGEGSRAVQLGRIDGRWVAHGLTGDSAIRQEMVPADGLLTSSGRVELLDDEEALASAVLLAGCAPALSLWARSAERWHPGLRVRWVHANSERALSLLARGEVHAAGVHFHDGNGERAQAALGESVKLVELGVWQEGLAVAAGNPKGIEGVVDLVRPDVTLVNREAGAGCRRLLEAELQEVGISPASVRGYGSEVGGHAEVAQAIARGQADAGVTVSAMATAFGLEFLPLRAVRYELAMRAETFALPSMQQLLETLQHRWIRTQLQAIGGYDISDTGVFR